MNLVLEESRNKRHGLNPQATLSALSARIAHQIMVLSCSKQSALTTRCFIVVVILTRRHGAAQLENVTDALPINPAALVCEPGIIVPIWEPLEIFNTDKVVRGFIYFLSLTYFFLGVSIVSDKFMSSIEVITSKEKEIAYTDGNGNEKTVSVRIWNETISNLTLMALGSSAPEIMLSAFEIIRRDFKAGDLGPGTIVGSAAFNMFVIIGLCVYVIPEGEVRRIKHLRVFFVTATWSLFAYLWLYLIIAVISEGEVSIWEGIITLALFPTTVITAYMADKYVIKSDGPKSFRASSDGRVIIEGDADTVHLSNPSMTKSVKFVKSTDELMAFEEQRKDYIETIRRLRKQYPQLDMPSLEEKAVREIMNSGVKSRAYHRVRAIRKLTGSGATYKRASPASSLTASRASEQDLSPTCKVFFQPAHYTVMESCETVTISVTRTGADLQTTILVDYITEPGTATPGVDYIHKEGTVAIPVGERTGTLNITIIDDDIFEEDETFFVKLSNLRAKNTDGTIIIAEAYSDLELGTPSVATVMILDDDHSGCFQFDAFTQITHEGVGECLVRVIRTAGARGCVAIPYTSTNGTATVGVDFERDQNQLVFQNNEYEQFIPIRIKDSEMYSKNLNFFLELSDPILIRDADDGGVDDERDPNNMKEEDRMIELGKPKLGDQHTTEIFIEECQDFKQTVDKVIRMRMAERMYSIAAGSWVQQMKEAFSVNAGGDDDEEQQSAKLSDYILHYISLVWKVFFSLVPPTDYCGGWACFVFSILGIGLLTAVIGDLAAHFGCTIKLKDSVTAITFVALGTSVPDTFASKSAAIGDKTADSSIGNVTGSNAVNVFLGIGVAWTMAAIVAAARNERFTMEVGNLAFSVTTYCLLAFAAICLLMIRRRQWCGGELGGPKIAKYISAGFLVSLWLIYVILSSLEAYGVIRIN